MFIKVGGAQGVGKTTVIAILVSLLKDNDVNADLIKGSLILADILNMDVSELNIAKEEDKKSARDEMYRRMYKLDRSEPDRYLIRDGHFCIVDKEKNSFVEAPLQIWDDEQLFCQILIEADTDVIKKRRYKDLKQRPDRIRSEDAFIKKELKAERAIAKAQSKKINRPLIIVSNNSSPIKTANKIYQKLLKIDLKKSE